MANVNTRLHRQLMAVINRHHDHHEAARTVVHVAVLCALRSVGQAQTADFLRDTADYLEAHAITELTQ